MAVTAPVNLPVSDQDTPTPYRLATAAVRVWKPREATTTELRIIRARIEPNRGWWQFPLPRMPWEAVFALQVYVATVGLGVIALAAFEFFGSHR